MISQNGCLKSAGFPEFKTLNDPVLERMNRRAEEFETEFINKREPRWLTLGGNSGTGKTFLADMIYLRAYGVESLTYHKSLLSPVRKIFWPKFLNKLRSGDYHLADEVSDCNFVLIDDLMVEHDPSGFAKDKLSEILSMRIGKWTVLTTNFGLKEIRDMDERIASRMIRGRNEFLPCATTDFSER